MQKLRDGVARLAWRPPKPISDLSGRWRRLAQWRAESNLQRRRPLPPLLRRRCEYDRTVAELPPLRVEQVWAAEGHVTPPPLIAQLQAARGALQAAALRTSKALLPRSRLR